jgi:hypothetical protein
MRFAPVGCSPLGLHHIAPYRKSLEDKRQHGAVQVGTAPYGAKRIANIASKFEYRVVGCCRFRTNEIRPEIWQCGLDRKR